MMNCLKNLTQNNSNRTFSFKTVMKRFSQQKSATNDKEFDDFLPESIKYEIPKFKKNPKDLDFPLLINGAPKLGIKARFIADQIIARSQIPRYEILKHLFKIYRGVLLAATQNDNEFIDEYCEAQLATKLKTWLEDLKLKNQYLELLEDIKANKGKRIYPELHLYDSIVIKGIKAERELNMPENNYSVYNDIDHMGFISYIPLYLSDPKNFINKEETEKLLEEEFKTVIFRAYCSIKSGYKLFLKDEKNELVFDYDNNYTFNHSVVFENIMIPKEKFRSFSKNETYLEWVAKHLFGQWKLVDMDNWMKGNPFFLKKQ